MEKLSAESINFQITKILPFPEGKYMVKMNWFAYDINRAIIRLYITLYINIYIYITIYKYKYIPK